MPVKRMLFTVATLVIAACSGVLFAQNAPILPYYVNISGTVYSQQGDVLMFTPMSGVTAELELYVSDTTFYPIESTTTNQSGQFSLDSIETNFYSKYRLTFSADGYRTKQITTFISADTTFIVQLFALNGDSFNVIPQNPTSVDSIIINLFNGNHCCCAVYHNKSLTISDTVIYLSYSFDESNCMTCGCMGSGSWTNFSSGPIAAGKYAVYKAGQYYCPPGYACPAIYMLPVQIGTLVIDPVTGVKFQGRATSKNGFTFKLDGSVLSINLTRNSNITLRAYDLQGVLLGELLKRSLPAGSHSIGFGLGKKIAAEGNVILKISVDGVTQAMKMITVSQ